MADVPQVVFTDHDGNTYNIFTDDLEITLTYDGLTVSRQPGKVGITTDPIQEFETITCSCIMTGTALNSMRTQLRDTAKSYDGTDPKVAVVYDGTSSWTILVATVLVRYRPVQSNTWRVTFTFVERTL